MQEPHPKFVHTDYLAIGSNEQRDVHTFLPEILDRLVEFQPILTGTVPIGIHIPSSDLDVICCCSNLDSFANVLRRHFSDQVNFRIVFESTDGVPSVRANFVVVTALRPWEVEIFGQNVPTTRQHAYLHMIIEDAILQERGEIFRQDLIALKLEGMKTEPAFVQLLGIDRDARNDPYALLLDYGESKGYIDRP